MGNGISKILAALFGMILLGAVVGMDYVRYNARVADTPGAESYVAATKARILGYMEATPPVLVADHLAPAPKGWERRPTTQADAEAITGLAYDKENLTPDLTHDIVKRLLLARRDDTRITESYVNGDAVVVLRVLVTPAAKLLSASAKLKLRAEAKLRDRLLKPAVYLEVDGLVFHPLQQVTIDKQTGAETPVEYRRLWADVPGRLEVEVVTNASDEQILPILLGLDTRALTAMSDAPAADVALAAAEGSSDPAAATEAADTEPKAQACIRRAGKLICE